MYPGILILLNANHQAVNKHRTADIAIFCLSIGSKRHIAIIDIEGYLEPISSYRLSRRQDSIDIYVQDTQYEWMQYKSYRE
jgi:hypothetical protein